MDSSDNSPTKLDNKSRFSSYLSKTNELARRIARGLFIFGFIILGVSCLSCIVWALALIIQSSRTIEFSCMLIISGLQIGNFIIHAVIYKTKNLITTFIGIISCLSILTCLIAFMITTALRDIPDNPLFRITPVAIGISGVHVLLFVVDANYVRFLRNERAQRKNDQEIEQANDSKHLSVKVLLFVVDANYVRFLRNERAQGKNDQEIEQAKDSKHLSVKVVKSELETAKEATPKLSPGALVVIPNTSQESDDYSASNERNTAGSDVYPDGLNPFEEAYFCSSDEIKFSSTDSESEPSDLTESEINKLQIREWSFAAKNAASPASDPKSEFLVDVAPEIPQLPKDEYDDSLSEQSITLTATSTPKPGTKTRQRMQYLFPLHDVSPILDVSSIFS
uniref:Uncharacterized protein n=1 Tax=Panagrolaimus sp. JU765 TaxID=591449 RepID=A0AC34PW13_9BILA